jgi:DNA-binding MarR family transcriptional regulator
MTRGVDFGILLGLAYQSFVDELRATLDARGFTDLGRTYGYVFRALADGSLQLTQLAERLGMSDQGASKIVNEMEQRGYVERVADPTDRRAKQLRLTQRGQAALTAARRFHATYERRLARRLGDADVATVRRILSAAIAVDDHALAEARLRPL